MRSDKHPKPRNQQRLVQVTFTDGKTLAYTYDATGNRLNAAVQPEQGRKE